MLTLTLLQVPPSLPQGYIFYLDAYLLCVQWIHLLLNNMHLHSLGTFCVGLMNNIPLYNVRLSRMHGKGTYNYTRLY